MGAFAEGFKNAGDMWDASEKIRLLKAEAIRAQQAHDLSMQRGGLQLASEQRADTQARANVAADNEYGDTLKTGTLTGNTSGLSDPSARALYASGGQGLVDTTARLGNAEAGMMDQGSPYQVSGLGAPTVATKPLSQREQFLAQADMYRKKNDWDKHASSQKAAIQAHIAEFDAEGMKVMQDPAARAAAIKEASSGHYGSVPIYSMEDIVDKNGKPTGHKFMMNKGGKATEVTFSNAELAQIYGATKAMEAGYNLEGMEKFKGVSKDVADVVKQYNEGLSKSVESREKGTTAAENHGVALQNADSQRISALAAKSSAGAANVSAASIRDLRNSQIQDQQDARDRREAAATAAQAIQDLDPNSPTYVQDLKAATAKFNIANVRNGGQVSMRGLDAPGAGKGSSAALRYQDDNEWKEAEKKLIGDNTKPADIRMQKDQFYARRGYAPPEALKLLMSPRDPTTGEAHTMADVESFNQTFPQTPVDPANIPWLKKTVPGANPAVTAATGSPFGLQGAPLDVGAPGRNGMPANGINLPSLGGAKNIQFASPADQNAAYQRNMGLR